VSLSYTAEALSYEETNLVEKTNGIKIAKYGDFFLFSIFVSRLSLSKL